MERYDATTYGDRIAEDYDALYAAHDPGDAVAALVALADGGPVLELGIGTGRVALPLAATGVRVDGVDASAAMVARLRAKPGGHAIDVRIGDFGRDDLGGPYSLVFVAFNTLFALTSQDDQVACFAHVARALVPGGRFVVEVFVPDLTRFERGQSTVTTAIGPDHVVIDSSIHHPVEQRVDSMHTIVRADSTTLLPVVVRYAWPSELDLMARLAGLELEHRWGGWDRRPFDASSGRHVSVWRRP